MGEDPTAVTVVTRDSLLINNDEIAVIVLYLTYARKESTPGFFLSAVTYASSIYPCERVCSQSIASEYIFTSRS